LLKPALSFADDHRRAANSGLSQPSVGNSERHRDAGRTSHGVALFDHERMFAGARLFEIHEQAGKGRRG
jgi:hypothetical protein